MKTLQLGLIGYGNVGAGVVEFLKSKHDYIQDKFGVEFEWKGICDLRFKTQKPKGLGKILLTADASALLDDPSIDVIVELIGGLHPAKEFVLRALNNGKHVVTANKALIAQCGQELFKTAQQKKRNIYFETSVLAGVPIIKTLTEGIAGNQYTGIFGIINGTCNYILSAMASEGISFDQAVQQAQAKGFAETDPTLDINGMDSAYKLSILTYLAFGKFIQTKDIYTEGITHISHEDIQYAEELGLCIKLLGIAKQKDGGIEARVHPTLIRKDHPLASINGVLNAVLMEADPLGDVMLSGEGAGQMAAASGVVSDLINLATRGDCDPSSFIGNYFHEAKGLRLTNIDHIATKFYVRFTAVDKPGVLSKIAGVFGRYGIGINSVSQKTHSPSGAVPLIIITDCAPEKKVRQALKHIHDKLSVIKSKPVAIRMENL